MIRTTLTVPLLLLCCCVQAQRLAITYLDSSWELTSRKFAEYYRVGVIDNINLRYHGEVKDYYVNGKLQMKGKFSNNIKADTFYFHYPSGELMCKGLYQNNKRYGIWTYYYENGKVKDKVIFDHNLIGAIEHYDENGDAKIVKGTGPWRSTFYHDFTYEIIAVDGAFKDSLRHGTWTYYATILVPGIPQEKKLVCIEEYEHGNFIAGKFFSKNGKVRLLDSPAMPVLPESIKFKKMEQWIFGKYASKEEYPYLKFLPAIDSAILPVEKVAEFPGGKDALTRYFIEHISLSKSFIEEEKERKLQFDLLISSNGRLEIAGDMYFPNYRWPAEQAFHDQAVKALKKLQFWKPAIREGKAVNSYMEITLFLDSGNITIELIPLYKTLKPGPMNLRD